MPRPMSKNKERVKRKVYAIRNTNMIKTLRITGVIAAILAAVFFVFPAAFGVRSDEDIEEFLNSTGVIEKLKNKAKSGKTRGGSEVSPLVSEAKAFALYLNPPPKEMPKPRMPKKARITTDTRPKALVSPKFKLVATSVYASRPEMSLALIDEVGKGLHWVRQSGKVGHLVIEQVKDGVVVIQDGNKTRELKAEERPARISLLQGSAPPKQSSKPTSVAPVESVPDAVRSKPVDFPAMDEARAEIESTKRPKPAPLPEPRRSTEEETALIKEFFAEIQAAAEAARISPEEAEKLSLLGEELGDVKQKPSQVESRKTRRLRNMRLSKKLRQQLEAKEQKDRPKNNKKTDINR